MGGLALALFLVAWPRDKTRKTFTKKAFASIDVLGGVLLLTASILLVYVLTQAGSYAIRWDSLTAKIMLAVSPICFIGFVCWQLYLAKHPSWPVQLTFPITVAVQRVIGGAIL